MEDTLITTHRDEFTFEVLDGDPCHLGAWDFWTGDFPSVFEPCTMKWIRDEADPSKSFLDIGAWVGPTTIWAAQFYRSVHAYEPDPVAFKYLEANCNFNVPNNMTPNNLAITSDGKPVNLLSQGNLGNSMTSLVSGSTTGHQIESYSLQLALSLGDFGAMKIDIEGGEILLIDEMVRLLSPNPIPLIFSFHDQFYPNGDADAEKIKEGLGKIYSQFFLSDGSQVEWYNLPKGFSTILCK